MPKLSEPQKRVLRELYGWGDCEIRASRESMSHDRRDVLDALRMLGYLQCRWTLTLIIFCLTPKGREIAKELFSDLTGPEESL